MDPLTYYTSALSEVKISHSKLLQRVNSLSWLRLLIAVVILVAIYFCITAPQLSTTAILVAAIAIFLLLVRLHTAAQQKASSEAHRISILQQALASLNGDYSSFYNGQDFVSTSHPYTFDLDIFGERSIFQVLCRAATRHGRVVLADRLKDPYATTAEIRERQQMLQELSAHPDLLVNFRVAGAGYEEKPGDLEKIKAWLDMPDLFTGKLLQAIAWLVPAATISLLVVSIFQGSVHPLIYSVILFNWVLLGNMSRKTKQIAFQVAKSADLVAKYETLIRCYAQFNTTQPQLQLIRENFHGALYSISRFKKLAHIFESRENGMVGPLMNTLFLFDIQCALRLERWRRKEGATLHKTLDELHTLDMLISLATYAFDHPGYTYPDIKEGGEYKAHNVAHPLLQASAVGNSFTLGKSEQLFLLTGANMTGKSTFIRTVGVNLVLAYMGLPLRAEKVQMPLVRLFTSIRITDSVQDDVSYFKAELNRIHEMMAEITTSGAPYLVMLDEPLRGTNIGDKQAGTRAIVGKLLQLNAVGIIATHDTILCALEEETGGKVRNYHFESTLQEHELVFDYTLKPGGSTSNNATILMKQMGII